VILTLTLIKTKLEIRFPKKIPGSTLSGTSHVPDLNMYLWSSEPRRRSLTHPVVPMLVKAIHEVVHLRSRLAEIKRYLKLQVNRFNENLEFSYKFPIMVTPQAVAPMGPISLHMG
jgi:hypothetical protein